MIVCLLITTRTNQSGEYNWLECFVDHKSLSTVVYVIVIAQVPGIYGSKQTESEGVARGRGLFTTAINPWPPVL